MLDHIGGAKTGMETFAAKVRYGYGPRFESILEERGGWIASEAQRHDVEMADAVIKVLEKANKHILGNELNLVRLSL